MACIDNAIKSHAHFLHPVLGKLEDWAQQVSEVGLNQGGDTRREIGPPNYTCLHKGRCQSWRRKITISWLLLRIS